MSKNLLLVLSLIPVFVFAQSQPLPDPGLTPDSPFYFLKTWKEQIQLFFIFDAEQKAKQYLHFAEVRLAEYQKMIEKGKQEIAEKTLTKYQDQLNHALAKAEELKSKSGEKANAVKTQIEEAVSKHLQILQENLQKVPEAAREGLEKAIEASQKGIEKVKGIIKKKEEGNENKETAVRAIVEGFLKAQQMRNFNDAMQFLTPEFARTLNQVSFLGTSNPHMSRFVVNEVTCGIDECVAKTRVWQEYTGQGEIGYNDNEYIFMGMEVQRVNAPPYGPLRGISYRISDIKYGPYVSSASVDTSAWQTYRNEKYGFEFKYPKEVAYMRDFKILDLSSDKLEFRKGGTSAEVLFNEALDQQGTLRVRFNAFNLVFQVVKLPNYPYLEPYLSQFSGEVKEFRGGNESGISLLGSILSQPGFQQYQVFFEDKANIFFFTYIYDTSNENSTLVDWYIVQKILSTFKFISPTEFIP